MTNSFFQIMNYNNQIINKNLIKSSLSAIKSIFKNKYKTFNNINIINVYKQPNNLLNLLKFKQNFINKYVNKCGNPRCKLCPQLITFKNKIIFNNRALYINKTMNCNSFNVIYLINCPNCQQIYIGKTSQKLHLRINLHRSQIFSTSPVLTVSSHIKSCSSGQFTVAPIFCSSPLLLDAAEKYFINSLRPQLNV